MVSAGYGTPHVRFGNGDASGTFSGVIQNLMFIAKIGSGTQILTGDNTYSGTTTVSSGTLQVDGSLGTNTVTATGGTLGGKGTINGPVIINSGGTLSAGSRQHRHADHRQHANLECGRHHSTQARQGCGHARFRGGHHHAHLRRHAHGDESRRHTGVGDSFQLFNATNYSGDFAAMNLPALGAGMVWNWTPANGTLTVVKGETPPVLSGFGPLTGSSFPLTFSGPSGQTYKVLASTNVALPLANWMQLSSGTFGASAVTYTETAATNNARFYRIVSP